MLEQKIELKKEVSVIVARNQRGETAVYPVGENEHRNGILHMTSVPARVDDPLAEQARKQALQLVDRLGYVGVLAVEFFIDSDNRLLFNEMAPRPHNSGHYTMDACVTSQFEQQARVICGLPPGDVTLLSPVVMVNLLGDLWRPDWRVLLNEPGLKLHLYGKKEARPGRKMGHYNVLHSELETALAHAELRAGLGAEVDHARRQLVEIEVDHVLVVGSPTRAFSPTPAIKPIRRIWSAKSSC